jgi:putative nucleotidyltransferase with HDIG domain
MVLAEDVRDMNGRRLLAAGTSLTEKGLQVLKTWGITDVRIDPARERIETEAARDGSEETGRETRELFASAGLANPLMQELFEQSLLVRETRPYDRFLPRHAETAVLDRGTLPRSAIAVAEMGEYAALPEVYHHILAVINDQYSSTIDISDAVTKDPSFTSRLLKLANSSFYALKNSVDTVSKAVSIIGTRQLGTLALGISVSRSLFVMQNDDSSMIEFWRHSVATAIAARTLAIFLKEKNTERFFIGGLLHDIGKPLLYSRQRDTVCHIDDLCRAHGLNQFTVEKNLLGFTHADVGREVCRRMSLPENLLAMITDHHEVAASLRPFEAAVIHLADIISNGVKKGSSGEPFVPSLQPAALEQLVLQPSAVAVVVRQVETHAEEISRIMLNG